MNIPELSETFITPEGYIMTTKIVETNLSIYTFLVQVIAIKTNNLNLPTFKTIIDE